MQFFTENAAKIDAEEEALAAESPTLDLDDVHEGIDDSLKTAGDLAKRLGEINHEMVDYMYNYAQAKASNK